MPKRSRVTSLILKICGGLLIVGGFLLFIGNQMGIFPVFPMIALVTIVVGILLLVAGKSVALSAVTAKQQVPTSLPQDQNAKVPAPNRPLQKVAMPHPIRPTPSVPQVPIQPSNSNIVRLRTNLLVKCLHNEKQVDRLIEFERRLTPIASEEQLLQAAINRWEHDNR